MQQRCKPAKTRRNQQKPATILNKTRKYPQISLKILQSKQQATQIINPQHQQKTLLQPILSPNQPVKPVYPTKSRQLPYKSRIRTRTNHKASQPALNLPNQIRFAENELKTKKRKANQTPPRQKIPVFTFEQPPP